MSYEQKGYFQVQDSKVSLSLILVAALAFAVLVCFYPGPAGLGSFFWVVFGLFAVLALGVAIKLIIMKPIMRVDKHGIQFFSSGNLIKWQQFKRASVEDVPYDDGDTKTYLVINYYIPNVKDIARIEFPLGGLLDKEGDEIIEAIKYFRQLR